MDIVYEALDKNKHNRTDFDCGEADLNNFLQRNASQNQIGSFSVTHVAVAKNQTPPKTIYGYYTLVSSAVQLNSFGNEKIKSPTRLVPTVKLARIARNKLYTKKGFGEHLLIHAIHRILSVATEQIGVYALELDVTNDSVKPFYKKYGFKEFPSKPNSLYASIDTLKKLL